MSNPDLGKIIEDRQYRDAVHVAIAPVMADEPIAPGWHVGLVVGSQTKVTAITQNAIGIADPFLTSMIRPGQKFWLLLYPKTITNLRHEWSHPAFSNDPSAAQFLQDVAGRIDCSYEDLLKRLDLYADDSCGDDDHIQEGLNTLQDETVLERMWNAYESIRSRKVDSEIKTSSYFRCAC